MAKVWAGFNWQALVTTTMKRAVGNSLTAELISASRELRSVVKEVRRDSSVSIVITLGMGD